MLRNGGMKSSSNTCQAFSLGYDFTDFTLHSFPKVLEKRNALGTADSWSSHVQIHVCDDSRSLIRKGDPGLTMAHMSLSPTG